MPKSLEAWQESKKALQDRAVDFFERYCEIEEILGVRHEYSNPLGRETYITDAVFTEVTVSGHARLFTRFVDASLLKVDRISSNDALEWLSKVQSYAESLKISFADATALICAEEKDAILLTGDRLLRLQAENYGVDVRGVLWVMDMLLWEEIIGFQRAIEALNEVLGHGARLPSGDCLGRLENWRCGVCLIRL